MKKTITKDVSMQQLSVYMSEYFNVTLEQIFSKTRVRAVIDARHHLFWYAHYYGEYNGSSTLISKQYREMGGFATHATVIHAINKVNDILDYSTDANTIIKELNDLIGVENKTYVTLHFFLHKTKGTVIPLSYKGANNILWKHDGVELKGNRLYLKGDIKQNGEGWNSVNDVLYEYEGLICIGTDAERIYIES